MTRPNFEIVPSRDCYLGMHLEENQSHYQAEFQWRIAVKLRSLTQTKTES